MGVGDWQILCLINGDGGHPEMADLLDNGLARENLSS